MSLDLRSPFRLMSRWTRLTLAPPDITGLTGIGAVFRILAHTKKPMKQRDVLKWLENHGQRSLTKGQITGAFYHLLNTYDNVVEKTAEGTYRIHSTWNGKPLDEQTRETIPAVSPPPSEHPKPTGEVVIPCYGVYWDRSLVAWDAEQMLLGASGASGEDAVDFAGQTGVYLLYQWPRVNYVGRAASGNLYQRLRTHNADPKKGPWDKFSWFGLRAVGDNGQLDEPRGDITIEHEVTMMEALLISALEPPFNNRRGDWMGRPYFQVPSPEIEERERGALAARMKQLLEKVM